MDAYIKGKWLTLRKKKKSLKPMTNISTIRNQKIKSKPQKRKETVNNEVKAEISKREHRDI